MTQPEQSLPAASMSGRLKQVLLIGSFLPLCWLAMMAVHEAGHVLAAKLTGGVVAQVVLHPFSISRTDLSVNPRPLIVAWGGPIVGAIVPLIICIVWQLTRWRWSYLVRFFAGFCLVANGAYLGVGSLAGIGDSGDIMRYGTPAWFLWIFGLATVPLGLWLWHGLGKSFGLGASADRVETSATYFSCGLLVVTLALEFCFSPR